LGEWLFIDHVDGLQLMFAHAQKITGRLPLIVDRFHRGRALAGIQLFGGAVVCLPVFIGGAPIVFVTAALLAAVRVATIAVR
jgi:hypothetical protein